MNFKLVKLGSFISLYDEINSNNEFSSIDDLQGINNDKYFQECQSNKNDIELDKYRICRKGMFAYNKATSRNGEKISIAYREESDCLVSPSYICFRIKDESILCHEYLMLLFRRPIFDRYVRFNSWGSATEFFTFDDMCDVEILLPPIEVQKRIVNATSAIEKRINWIQEINHNLEEKAYLLYLQMIQNKEKNGVLSDICKITMGSSPSGDTLNKDGNGMVFYQGKTDFGFRYPTVRCYTTDPKKIAEKGDVLMSVRAPVGDINVAIEKCCIGRGIASLRPNNNLNSFLFYTMLKLYHELNEFNDKGTVFGSINKDELHQLPIVIPTELEIEEFEKSVKEIESLINYNELEKRDLEKTMTVVFLQLSK